jgi:UDP-2-acetamido-3-amino-2,3-dideoxy-glucuronate N-acetyltransferase
MSAQEPVRTNSKQTQTKVATTSTVVRGVDVYEFPWVKDPRGDLTVGEFESGFPFRRERYSIISGVPSGEIRGEHAHKECHQFLICAYGQCSVTVDNGRNRLEVQLNRPNLGIYVPPMI